MRKSDFSSILIFTKEKFPQSIQAKRQMQAFLKEYPYIFQKYFLNSQLEKKFLAIQDPGILPFWHCGG